MREFELKKIGHVVLNVSDLEAAVRFYTEVLGLQISTTWPIFFSSNSRIQSPPTMERRHVRRPTHTLSPASEPPLQYAKAAPIGEE